MRIPKHVSGLLISLWEPANSLFVRVKYVTPIGKPLHAGYVQKAVAHKNISCEKKLYPQVNTDGDCFLRLALKGVKYVGL